VLAGGCLLLCALRVRQYFLPVSSDGHWLAIKAMRGKEKDALSGSPETIAVGGGGRKLTLREP